MTEGSTIKRHLDSKISDVEGQLKNSMDILKERQQEINSLEVEKDQYYSKLAEIYLPSLNAETVINTLKARRDKISAIYEAKEKYKINLDSQLNEAEQKMTSIDKNISSIDSMMVALANEKDDLAKLTVQKLHNDDKYQELVAAADELGLKLKENESIMGGLGKSYGETIDSLDQNKFFIYLKKRNFGTEKSSGNFITKKLDSWIANRIHFNENNELYTRLKNKLEGMKKEFEDRKINYASMEEQMDKIEKKTSKDTGLDNILSKEESLSKNKTIALEERKVTENLRMRIHDERTALENTKDKYFESAKADMKDYLDDQSIENLRKMARDTRKTEEDDNIVEKIAKIDTTIELRVSDLPKYQGPVEKLSVKVKELKEIQSDFLSHNYSGSRAQFKSGFNVDEIIKLYLLNQLTKSEVWNKFETNYYKEAEPAISYNDTHNNSDSYKPRPHRNTTTHTTTRTTSNRTSSSIGGGSHRTGRSF